jgi:hypothetical protein
MRRFVITVAAVVCLAIALSAWAQGPAQCHVTGVIYLPLGNSSGQAQVASGIRLTIAVAGMPPNSPLISTAPPPFGVTSDSSGNVSFYVPQGATIRVSGYALGFDKGAGALLPVPNSSSATLSGMLQVPSVPVGGLVVTGLPGPVGVLTFGQGFAVSQPSTGNATIILAGSSGAGAPSTSNVPAGSFTVWKDTSGGSVRLYYNDSGTLKSVALN